MIGSPPVGRIAPSPTGFLHLGHARSFLLAWWHIRSRGGRLVVRLEDLDGPRVRPELCDAALRDLEWLGLDWDGSPVLQSAEQGKFRAALDQLHASHQTYPCICTRADVRAAQSAPQQGDKESRYPGSCRGRFANIEAARSASGRDPGVRFSVPSVSVTVSDGFAGEHAFDVQEEVGDFLIARRDGSPAYQLAVVVDDADQGVTEVLRGDDLLPSTARQRLLQMALALPTPRWFHVPLVLDETGRRLAKRADDLSLRALREEGTDPRALVAWAAQSAGVEVGQRASATDCVAAFSLERVPRQPVVLDARTVDSLRNAR